MPNLISEEKDKGEFVDNEFEDDFDDDFEDSDD